jgi:aryl-alcohol dehydrogenase-like predicted oxidoreductase
MEYRKLGNSGLEVSLLGLGTNNFGARSDEQESARVIDQAVDIGVTFIDTANVYTQGKSEEYIGKALKGKRHNVILTTKFALPFGKGPNTKGGSRKHVMDSIESSLRRLQTDYLDLYQMHMVDRETPIEETLRALDDLVRQGKVRYIGCSNFQAWHVCEAIWTSRALSLNSFVSVQPYYNVLKRDAERELVPLCKAYRISVIPYFPLESGLLTGKYKQGAPVPKGSRMEKAPAMAQRFLNDANFQKVAALEKVAQERDHGIADLALSWLAANPAVSTVIAGATKPEQVVANAKSIEWKMTAEDLKAIDLVCPPPV